MLAFFWQLPLCHGLDKDPTAGELVKVPRQWQNGEAMSPDDLPVELLKLATRENHEVLTALHWIILAVRKENKVRIF